MRVCEDGRWDRTAVCDGACGAVPVHELDHGEIIGGRDTEGCEGFKRWAPVKSDQVAGCWIFGKVRRVDSIMRAVCMGGAADGVPGW